MLSENVSDELFSFCLRSERKKSVCEALMDQSVVCGVGNYVKAEALYRAGISPWRTVDTLSDQEISDLNAAAKQILRQAYADQGASIRDYRTPDGEQGSATLQFMAYGKQEDPSGKKIIREQTPDGRTTHWCPEVQK
jgi:formamidopyrimidine-DNA glycosylase